MFKPNIAPILLDQMKSTELEIATTESGERVIVDPQVTAERIMLWFYLLINIGSFMAVPTSYTEKYVGWWLSFLIPLILYLPLPLLLWFLKKRLILLHPGGSDLPNVFRVLRICLSNGGWMKIGRHGFWESAKPIVITAKGADYRTQWDDVFVEDVRRTFQATAIFLFLPIQNINDNGLGLATNTLTTILTTNGVPNDVITNVNAFSIILFSPILNHGLYPLLRRCNIRFGPIAQITFGLFLSSVGGAGYTLITYYAYKLGPCGHYGTSPTCVNSQGISLVSPVNLWWAAIPLALGGISELFTIVPAYGIVYSRAPPNMRGLVSALMLFHSAIAYAIGLACSAVSVILFSPGTLVPLLSSGLS